MFVAQIYGDNNSLKPYPLQRFHLYKIHATKDETQANQ